MPKIYAIQSHKYADREQHNAAEWCNASAFRLLLTRKCQPVTWPLVADGIGVIAAYRMHPADGTLQRSGAAAQPADVVLVCFD
jgi:hypothetical protein